MEIDRHLKLRELAYKFAFVTPVHEYLNFWEKNQGVLQGCRMVFSHPKLESSPFPGQLSARTFGNDPKLYLNSFFAGPGFFFLTNELAHGHKYRGGVPSPMLDWSVSLDSNVVGDIHKFMTGKSLDAKAPAFVEAAKLIIGNKINTDATPYIFENFTKARTNKKHFDFVLNGFATFYRFSTGRLKSETPSCLADFEFSLTEGEAKEHALQAVSSMLNDPAMMEDDTKRLWHRRDSHLALLLIAIQYYTSNGFSAQDKLIHVMAELESKGSRLPERELLLGYRAFKNAKAYPFFSDNWPIPYNKKQNIVALLRNMAWDISFYRTMETAATKNDKGDYFIPFFLTFDWRLGGVNDIYRSMVFLIDDQEKMVYSISQSSLQQELMADGCWEEIKSFFGPERIAARFSSKVGVESLADYCEDAEKNLHQIVYGTPLETV